MRGTELTPREIADLKQRVLIIGNSGSGKTTVANRIERLFGSPVVGLDSIHWQGEGYGQKRDEQEARQLVLQATAAPAWIVEGVFGWLAQVAVGQATALIWLDFALDECRKGLLERGPKDGRQESFAELLAWCEDYWARKTSSSFEGHLLLYEGFASTKIRLRCREEVGEFLRSMEMENSK